MRREIRKRSVGANREHPLLAFVAWLAVHIVERLVALLGTFALFAVRILLGPARLDFALALLAFVLAFVALIVLLLFGPFVLGTAFFGFVGDHVPFDQFKIFEQLGGQAGKGALIVDREAQRIEVAPRFLLDPVAHQLEPRHGGVGRRGTGQAFAHDQPERGRQRHLVARARACDRVGAQPRFQRNVEIGGDPGIAAPAERLDSRALDRVEHRTRHRLMRGNPAVQRGIVIAQPQRETVGEAPRLGHLLFRQRARGHWHLDVLPRLARRIGGESELDLGLMRNRARCAAQHGLETIEGGLSRHGSAPTTRYACGQKGQDDGSWRPCYQIAARRKAGMFRYYPSILGRPDAAAASLRPRR
ncbi:hypothetical protein D9M73_96640 [compost metagenome]